ncbi:MAG: hypothetical protein WCD18_04900 [Thermosynechococcaceae cyanobacterium]
MSVYSVIELINSQMPKVTKLIDLTLTRESITGETYEDGMPDSALLKLFPMVQYMDRDLALMKLRRSRPSLAYVVGTDQDIPQDREQVQLTTENVGDLKIAKSSLFTETDFNLMYRMTMLERSGPAGVKAAQQIKNAFMAKTPELSQAVMNTLFFFSLRTALLGRVAYTDLRTKLPVTLTYVDQIPAGNLAATKTGNGRWSQPATANGIQDIVDHLDAYYGNIRAYPPFIGMGAREWVSLRNQNTTREVVLRGRGVITELGAVDAAALGNAPPPTLQEVSDEISRRLSRSDGTPGRVSLLVTDANYYSRDEAGVTTPGLYFPAGYYGFLWPGMVEQAILPNATNDFNGGLAPTTRVIETDPRRERFSVSGVCVPLVADPRRIASRNVENTAIA